MNRKSIAGILSILLLVVSAAFISIASAENDPNQTVGSQIADTPLLVEDFTYPAGSLLTNNGWTAHSSGGTNPIVTSSPGLTLTGYPSSGIGNAAALATSGEDVNRPFSVQSSGSVYAAFMVNVSEASTDPAGGYFFHLGPDPVGTTFRGRVFVKKNDANAVSFGISKGATAAADIAFTPFSYSLNTTYLLVVKYTIVDGASNDTVSLFVSTTTPANEPAPTVSATDISAQSDISPGTVSLRQGATATSPTARVDGIRVGTTWASVTATTSGGTPTPTPTVTPTVTPTASPTPTVTPSPTPSTTPTPDANVDMNGDGKSDWVITRSENGYKTWWVSINGSSATSDGGFGLPTDIATPEDFDGDGKDDLAVWRPDAQQSVFYIYQGATNTVRVENFGLSGDDPRVVGDYDGDGKADPAVYRKAAGTGQNFFYFRGSNNNPNRNITYVPFGGGINVRPHVGDYDGDGKNDFCIYTQSGQFILLKSSNFGVEYINWGIGTEALAPGDYDGDGRWDFTVVRNVNNQLVWYILERDGGGTGAAGIPWGGTGDVITPGDYDGDGKQDLAIWRGNATPSMPVFYVRRSSNNTLLTYQWGQQNDYPVANWFVHEAGVF